MKVAQGGQHVFVSLRVWDLTDMRAWVKLSMERTSDRARVSSMYSTHLRFSKRLREGAPALLECLLLTLPDASFEAGDGAHGPDTRTVNLQWESSLEQP